jgi:hypothetical protein
MLITISPSSKQSSSFFHSFFGIKVIKIKKGVYSRVVWWEGKKKVSKKGFEVDEVVEGKKKGVEDGDQKGKRDQTKGNSRL